MLIIPCRDWDAAVFAKKARAAGDLVRVPKLGLAMPRPGVRVCFAPDVQHVLAWGTVDSIGQNEFIVQVVRYYE